MLYGAETWTLLGMSKKIGSICDVGMEKDGACKMDKQNKKCGCTRKSGRKKNIAGTDKKRKRNWLGHWLRRNCLLKDALEGMVNGKKLRCRRRYRMRDNITINGLYEDTKGKAEKRVEWGMLSLQ